MLVDYSWFRLYLIVLRSFEVYILSFQQELLRRLIVSVQVFFGRVICRVLKVLCEKPKSLE